MTRALRLKRREQALAAPPHLVSDWDGGTRIGDALQALSRRAALRRLRTRRVRSSSCPTGWNAAISRPLRDAVDKLSRRRLAPELADAARSRLRLRAADRGADRHSPLRRRHWSTVDRVAAVIAHVALGSGKGERA